MAGGLAALLDDIAALTRLAAAQADDIAAASLKASSKAAGVVVDDAAVTPQYVQGVEPKRELSIIWRIAKGSLINKAIIIVFALLLSQFLPWLLTPLLMIGGAFLCYEGAHKVYELISPHPPSTKPAVLKGQEAENEVVKGAVRTDFILSAEIMVISLNEVASEAFFNRTAVLIVVAILITLVVYGAVGLLVKIDDIGLALAKRGAALKNQALESFGTSLVKAMPKVMVLISYIGMLAMLWVGGHILVVGAAELGLGVFYDLVHQVEHFVADALRAVNWLSATASWLSNTVLSLIFGLAVGFIILGALKLIPNKKH